jgi:hypothetical protein
VCLERIGAALPLDLRHGSHPVSARSLTALQPITETESDVPTGHLPSKQQPLVLKQRRRTPPSGSGLKTPRGVSAHPPKPRPPEHELVAALFGVLGLVAIFALNTQREEADEVDGLTFSRTSPQRSRFASRQARHFTLIQPGFLHDRLVALRRASEVMGWAVASGQRSQSSLQAGRSY